MEIIKLQNYCETGFLVKNVPEDGSDILFDMACESSDLEKDLQKYGSSMERIKYIFITHFHGDHYFADVAWELAQKNATIYMEESNWDAYLQEPLVAELHHFLNKIKDAGKVKFLPLHCEIKIGKYNLVWDNFNHGNARNLCYRLGEIMVTGDAPIFELFDDKNPNIKKTFIN